MIWLFVIAGAVVGAIAGEWPGMIAGGVMGWVVGMIVKAMRTPPAPLNVADSTSSTGVVSLESLAKRVAALEAKLARMEGVPVEAIATAAPEAASMPAAEPIEQAPAAIEQPAAAEVIAEPPVEQTPPVPKEPAKPNFIVAWFTGGNTIVRVGLVILFFGLAFLVKYGVEHQFIPVEVRVAAVAAVGLVLLVLGWRLRGRRAAYALSLQGGGVGVLYLTIFGGLKLYGLLPAGMAFVMLVLISALSASLAVMQESLALAVFGAAGGFLAPIFASTGGGSHVMLFSYYLVLNAGIVGVAWFRAWRVLNVVGFLFTFGIGLAWGLRSYRPELFDTTEPFLIAFFLMYVAIAIQFARMQEAVQRSYVDGTIVFGVPIAAFGLQAGLMRGSEFGLAFSALGAGALYIALTMIPRRIGRERWQMLCEAFLALGVVFVTLAIPLALDARWTSAAWALEGAAIVWIGLRQNRKLACFFGAFLELAAGGAFFKALPAMPPGPPLADATFVGGVLISFAGIFTYRVLRPRLTGPHAGYAIVASLFFLWGVAWWIGAGLHEIDAAVPRLLGFTSAVAFLAATVLGFAWIGKREYWEAARWPSWAFAPVLLLASLVSLGFISHPFRDLGWIAWPFAFIAHFVALSWQRDTLPVRWGKWLHALGVIVLAIVGADELAWLAAKYTASGTAWSLASVIVVPAALILAISSRRADEMWPVEANLGAYRLGAVVMLLIGTGLWSLYINFDQAGSSDPLPYIPFLNAIDLAHLFAGFAVASATFAWKRSSLQPPKFLRGKAGISLASLVAFFWLNAVLLRTLHHWTGVAYDFDALWDSVVVQASLSIFWSVLALSLMLAATRLGHRVLWIVGASLMAVVVLKLVLVDLSHLGGIERIVSFIGVGVLMLVIGYFSPVPPKRVEVPA